jgi:hypothetical protein
MNFVDALMIGGLCIMVAAGAFLLRTALRAARRADEQGFRRMDDHPGGQLDLYMAFLWSGMLLVQGSNIVLHLQTGSIHNVSLLAWMGTAGDIFICGIFAGRLLLRREMRWHKEKREERA